MGRTVGTTWYGGGQYAEYYRAAMFGLGFNLGDFGAISFDATQAKSTLADQSEHKGQSYRFLYAKRSTTWALTFN